MTPKEKVISYLKYGANFLSADRKIEIMYLERMMIEKSSEQRRQKADYKKEIIECFDAEIQRANRAGLNSPELKRAKIMVENEHNLEPAEIAEQFLSAQFELAQWDDAETGLESDESIEQFYRQDDCKLRPCYQRDHYFCLLKDKEGLKPAKIRDRWNDLQDEVRKKICPSNYARFEEKDDRNTVRAGIKKAEKEVEPAKKI